jgi:hypothetical protein
MGYYFRVGGQAFPPTSPDGGITYTEQATRGITYTRSDGQTVTRASALTLAQRVKTGRLVVEGNAALGGVLTTAQLVALRAALEGATDAAPVRVETDLTLEPLDGFFVLDPGSGIGITPLSPANDYHEWSATLQRIS